jgi:hypothetical protein
MRGGCAPSTWAADPSARLLGTQPEGALLPLSGRRPSQRMAQPMPGSRFHTRRSSRDAAGPVRQDRVPHEIANEPPHGEVPPARFSDHRNVRVSTAVGHGHRGAL